MAKKTKITRAEYLKAMKIIENYLEQEKLSHYLRLCYILRVSTNPLKLLGFNKYIQSKKNLRNG